LFAAIAQRLAALLAEKYATPGKVPSMVWKALFTH
jgi:hypothetical protein